MEKYGDASYNLRLKKERELEKQRDSYLKRKVKSSPIVKYSLLNKIIHTIKNLNNGK